MLAAHMRPLLHHVQEVRGSAFATGVATLEGGCSRKGAAKQNLEMMQAAVTPCTYLESSSEDKKTFG